MERPRPGDSQIATSPALNPLTQDRFPEASQDGIIGQPSMVETVLVDPFTFTREGFGNLNLSGQDNVALSLLRLGSIEANDKLQELRPGFEMAHPISPIERAAFREFEKIGRGENLVDDGFINALGEGAEKLLRRDHESKSKGEILLGPRGERPNIEGFKFARWDRDRLEEVIREEQSQVVKVGVEDAPEEVADFKALA